MNGWVRNAQYSQYKAPVASRRRAPRRAPVARRRAPRRAVKVSVAGCNWQCYLNRYKDLQKAFGPTNVAAAKKHFYKYGKKEGRNCKCPAGKSTLVGKHCRNSRYPYSSYGGKLCYSTASYANAHGRNKGSGPCGSWCTNTLSTRLLGRPLAAGMSGCGARKNWLCSRMVKKCANRRFPYVSYGGKLCYKTKRFANLKGRGIGSGPCNSWCTNTLTWGVGCGKRKNKLCSKVGDGIFHKKLLHSKKHGKPRRGKGVINYIAPPKHLTLQQRLVKSVVALAFKMEMIKGSLKSRRKLPKGWQKKKPRLTAYARKVLGKAGRNIHALKNDVLKLTSQVQHNLNKLNHRL